MAALPLALLFAGVVALRVHQGDSPERFGIPIPIGMQHERVAWEHAVRSAVALARACPPTVFADAYFDFDETLVDTSRVLAIDRSPHGDYELYVPREHAVRALHELRAAGVRVRIVTARPRWAASIVYRNCALAGIRIPAGSVHTSRPSAKAAKRASLSRGARIVLAAGDMPTDIDGHPEAVTVLVDPSRGLAAVRAPPAMFGAA